MISDRTSLPRFWATVWLTGLGGAGKSENTQKARLRHIGAFYEACDARYGPDALDRAIGGGHVNAVLAMLGDFYLTVSTIQSPDSWDVSRWEAVRAFSKAVALLLTPWDAAWNVVPHYLESLGEIRRGDEGKFRFVRALPDLVLDELLAIAHPESELNPFKDERVRWRNWLIVHLLLLGGLRRGESLLLQVDSLKHDVDRVTGQLIYWLDVTTTEYEDERATKPSIKTAESHRQIPVLSDLVAIYEHYVNEMRVSDGDVPFLLTSARSSALSAESVTKMFEQYTAALSPVAYARFYECTGGKRHISPHDLRHTSATARYALFMAQEDGSKELTLQRMRAFFGWSVTSKMPELYAKAAIQDDLLRSWNDLFDKRILRLRAGNQ
ncbi:tyrosine-type recombinase/integrase [Pelomonas sp. V22]|uniref:tyrosine-type recombinase/integrase n=1 Tax=Pelomonas sp. V22 TaxID=2822139 RepID=UPI0024A9FC25|nr:tyrosine-type recombinase/integrase [Pelomonas sp. V22]